MLLAIDVGNTNTKVSLVAPRRSELLQTWRVATDPQRMPDEWHALLASLFVAAGHSLAAVTAVAIASVSPAVTRWLGDMSRDLIGLTPEVLTSDRDLGIPVRTDAPSETGIDRVLNGLAAYRRFGGPVVVVDCGTATKFDAVDAGGAFVGGAIGPGPRLILDGLAVRAARLYQVEIAAPDRAIGTNTVASIQSGVVLGYVALCEGMIRQVASEIGAGRVIVTGGAGSLIAERLPMVSAYLPTLTTEGIVAAYQHITSQVSPAVRRQK